MGGGKYVGIKKAQAWKTIMSTFHGTYFRSTGKQNCCGELSPVLKITAVHSSAPLATIWQTAGVITHKIVICILVAAIMSNRLRE